MSTQITTDPIDPSAQSETIRITKIRESIQQLKDGDLIDQMVAFDENDPDRTPDVSMVKKWITGEQEVQIEGHKVRRAILLVKQPNMVVDTYEIEGEYAQYGYVVEVSRTYFASAGGELTNLSSPISEDGSLPVLVIRWKGGEDRRFTYVDGIMYEVGLDESEGSVDFPEGLPDDHPSYYIWKDCVKELVEASVWGDGDPKLNDLVQYLVE